MYSKIGRTFEGIDRNMAKNLKPDLVTLNLYGDLTTTKLSLLPISIKPSFLVFENLASLVIALLKIIKKIKLKIVFFVFDIKYYDAMLSFLHIFLIILARNVHVLSNIRAQENLYLVQIQFPSQSQAQRSIDYTNYLHDVASCIF